MLMKVGISFVSTQDALQNLKSEDPGWSLQRISTQAHHRWNALLGRIAVHGGTAAQQHTFYTALYHSLLFPNVVSDVSGRYEGSDGKVHTAGNREVYANFSEWDIYRSEVQLESLLDPHAVGDMVQSLLDDAQQTGWLPKWAIVGGDESQMNGDSADPIIADALAMGVHNFDVGLGPQVHGQGGDTERDGPWPRDRAAVPEPVPVPALRQCGIARPDVHRLLDRRLRHPRIRHRRLLHRPGRDGGARPVLGLHHEPARRQLGVRVQSRHRLRPGPRRRRQLPSRQRLRGVPARTGRTAGLRRGQRGAVHLVRPAGPRCAGIAHGRRRGRHQQARGVHELPQREPRRPRGLVRQRARRMGTMGVRLFRSARPDPALRARHRGQRVRRCPGGRTRERRPGRPVLVVRLGGAWDCSP